MTIACLLIPDIVTVNQMPVILLNPANRVQGASLAAAHQGVTFGMPSRRARALCPEAGIFPFEAAPYQELVAEVLTILGNYSQRVEPVPGFWEVAYPTRKGRPLPPPSSAVWYLDLGKTRKGESLALAQQIGERFYRELGRSPAIGLGSSKFIAAAIARRARPGLPRAIPPGSETAFLAGQPVTLLPLDTETLRRLHLLGLHTLGQLATLPPGALAAQFGQTGRQMAQLALGQDDRPVAAIQTQPEEGITLQLHGAVEDREALATILHALAADLAGRLEKRNTTARRLDVRFDLDDGGQKTTWTTLRQPTHDAARLSREFIRLLNRCDFACGVVAVAVTARDLHAVEWRQLDLFGTQLDADDRLRQLVAALTPRFGGDPLYRVHARQREHRLIEGRYRFDPAGVA